MPIATPAKSFNTPNFFCVGDTVEEVLDESRPTDRRLMEDEAVVLLANHQTYASGQTVFAPGETVFARLVNTSLYSVTDTFAFVVWRRTADGWVRDPLTPEGKGPLGPTLQLEPGAVGVCTRVKLPIDQKLGHYKVAKQIGIRGLPWTSRAAKFVVSAQR
ncbi:MAG TPA: hypothetical protein VFI03_03630 [Solirubrobacterales bacterium]|nr:hypothetical protein [Solirubrobacterales bacterium]